MVYYLISSLLCLFLAPSIYGAEVKEQEVKVQALGDGHIVINNLLRYPNDIASVLGARQERQENNVQVDRYLTEAQDRAKSGAIKRKAKEYASKLQQALYKQWKPNVARNREVQNINKRQIDQVLKELGIFPQFDTPFLQKGKEEIKKKNYEAFYRMSKDPRGYHVGL